MTNEDLSPILSRAESGDPSAAADLLPLVYEELRRLAALRLAQEKPGQTLQATALVHDAYLRLVGAHQRQRWDSRGHFFAAAAEAIRRILIERARRKARLRHGGGKHRLDLDHALSLAEETHDDLLLLDDALERLAAAEPEKAQLVKLRYFAGCSVDEAAELLGISRATANRHWAYARAWLLAELQDAEETKNSRNA